MNHLLCYLPTHPFLFRQLQAFRIRKRARAGDAKSHITCTVVTSALHPFLVSSSQLIRLFPVPHNGSEGKSAGSLYILMGLVEVGRVRLHKLLKVRPRLAGDFLHLIYVRG